jgi:hypothetical protein
MHALLYLFFQHFVFGAHNISYVCLFHNIFSIAFRTICGYPFKKLDKKSEKQFLFSRRQRLLELLEASTDAGDVLDYTIMLLFQQVKNLVVSGSHLRTDILKLLVSERKISDSVATALTELAKAVPPGEADITGVDPNVVETVKACGHSRDISKHTIQ